MANKVINAESVLYEAGMDIVRTLDIVVKGTVRASRGDCTIDLPVGSIIGIGEQAGMSYVFSYEAATEVTLYSYPYESEASLVALFKANPKLLGTLVASSIRFARNLQSATLDTMELARSEYAVVREAEKEYPHLAMSAGERVQTFPELAQVGPPTMLDPARGWHRDFVEDLFSHEATLKKDIFSIPSIGLGIGLTVNSYALESRQFIATIFDYLDDLHRCAGELLSLCRALKTKAAAGESSAAPGETIDDPSVHEPLESILLFAHPDAKLFEAFKDTLSLFMKNGDRYGSDDVIRKIRRDLSVHFYELYTLCFVSAFGKAWDRIPLGVRMFLLFGYVDEELAGPENTVKLAAIAKTLTPGRNGRVVTIYEWLSLIYEGRVMPSKNEFDLDYPNHLKMMVRNGDITPAEEARLLESSIDKLKFEIHNFFMLGNRMSFGRITTFAPVFDKDNVTRQLDQCYLNADKVKEHINWIREIDFRAFCRQGVFSAPDAGVNVFYTDVEVLPYVILMPNIGSRASLWQEIDSKKRSTPARMIISIFFTENPEDAFIKLTGEFRWEMCKTEQGVHWNDITDPSLTSTYCDYLQFYRKNSALSQETKEKISIALKNNSNNFKKVFVEDYFIYIKYESTGALRLNKNARGILFTFCPFSRQIRDQISDNPQFAVCIRQHDIAVAQRQKTIENLITKLQKKNPSVPEEILAQLHFLKR